MLLVLNSPRTEMSEEPHLMTRTGMLASDFIPFDPMPFETSYASSLSELELAQEAELVEQYRLNRQNGLQPRIEEVLAQIRADRQDSVRSMLLIGNLLTDVELSTREMHIS